MLEVGNFTTPRHFRIQTLNNDDPQVKEWVTKLNGSNENFTITDFGNVMFCFEPNPTIEVTYGDGLYEPVLVLDGYLASHPKEQRAPIMLG